MTDYERQTHILRAIGHPVRLQILDILRRGETCVCHIEAALGKRQAYISQQLMVLRTSGLVETRKEGIQVYYWLANDEVRSVLNLHCGPLNDPYQSRLDGCRCPSCTKFPR
jgi:DNA-binding transcriptional ArsR family regulator